MLEIGEPAAGGEIVHYEPDITGEYLDVVFRDVLPNATMAGLKIVYTPLHGVGRDAFTRAAFRFGVFPHVVLRQAEPDGTFPTVAFPNPEEPGALDAAYALARGISADVIIANDPDADRLAVALPRPDGSWRALTGNEVGWLIGDYLLAHTAGPSRLVSTTVVSSSLLPKMAAAAGVHCDETLTGFKWVVRPAINDPTAKFIFGYEEALGYAVNDIVRDKDGIPAAFTFLRRMADLRSKGSTPHRRLDELADRFGRHVTGQVSVRYDGPGALERMKEKMQSLRSIPLTEVAGRKIISVTDYLAAPGLPPSDILRYDFDDGSRVLLRPSGTEPKLKVYIEVINPQADTAIDDIATVFRQVVS